MCGVTDLPFRSIAYKLGAKYVVSEMNISHAVLRNIQREAEYTFPTIVQIAGNDPKSMSEAAQILEQKGPTGIDINMGCPQRKIAINSYAGAALLKDHKLAVEIVRAVKQASSLPVTVKMRTGWNVQDSIPLISSLIDEGITRIVIHGRTREQLYNGYADWNYIYHIKTLFPQIEIIGNGDIKSVNCAKEKIHILDGIMIGRGAYGKPWLIYQIDQAINYNNHIEEPSISERYNILIEHLDRIFMHYGSAQGTFIARKHIGWYLNGLHNATFYRTQINACIDIATIYTYIRQAHGM